MDILKESSEIKPAAQARKLLNESSAFTLPTNQFCHTELPGDRFIRLLRLMQTESEQTAVMLEIFSLDQLPSYEALSYTWGKALMVDSKEDENDHEANYEILVNNQQFNITEIYMMGLQR